jgi:hypothetical protein
MQTGVPWRAEGGFQFCPDDRIMVNMMIMDDKEDLPCDILLSKAGLPDN